MIVVLALLSAFAFGGGVVLQQQAALRESTEYAARLSLLSRLVRRPLWLVGLVADVVGFVLQAAALRHGSLVVVQPLITTSLVFTLAVSSTTYRLAISRREWAAVALVLAGLSVFLIVAAPTEQSVGVAPMRSWLLATVAVLAITIAAVASGLRTTGRARAALFGVAAGMADAFMAVLGKAFAGSWGHGFSAVVLSWTPYALLVAGAITLLLVSTAYQAGHPTISLPIITVTDPLIGSCIGIAMFGEELRIEGMRGPMVLAALAAMVWGLVALGRDRRVANFMIDEVPPQVPPPATQRPAT